MRARIRLHVDYRPQHLTRRRRVARGSLSKATAAMQYLRRSMAWDSLASGTRPMSRGPLKRRKSRNASQGHRHNDYVGLTVNGNDNSDFPGTVHVKPHAIQTVIAVAQLIGNSRIRGQTVIVLRHATARLNIRANHGVAVHVLDVQNPRVQLIDLERVELALITDDIQASLRGPNGLVSLRAREQ